MVKVLCPELGSGSYLLSPLSRCGVLAVWCRSAVQEEKRPGWEVPGPSDYVPLLAGKL
jgi:hypothetical protein